jgi:hypothetical protein
MESPYTDAYSQMQDPSLYNLSFEHFFGFGCKIDDTSNKLEGTPLHKCLLLT